MTSKVFLSSLLVFVLFLSSCQKDADTTTTPTSSSDIVGTWTAPICGLSCVWYLGSNGRGYLSTQDCNGICDPMILNFSYSVSGNVITSVYDATQPIVHCSGYQDSRPNSPGTQSQPFDLNGNTLSVSASGGTTVFTRSSGGGTGGGGTGGGGTTTGEGMFWVASDLGVGSITVTCNGITQTISSFYKTGTPSCGSTGCANFNLSAGNYSYAASASGYTWSGTINVSSGGCSRVQFYK